MTYSKHLHEMTDHPLKAFFSIIAGLIAGSHSLLHSRPFEMIAAMNYQAVVDLSIACFKAFMVGGAAWTGQTVAVWVRKRVIRWWKERKIKKT